MLLCSDRILNLQDSWMSKQSVVTPLFYKSVLILVRPKASLELNTANLKKFFCFKKTFYTKFFITLSKTFSLWNRT